MGLAVMDGAVHHIVGEGIAGFRDGPPETARFNWPQGMAIDPRSGVIYIADTENHAIRRMSPDGGQITTIAGTGRQARRSHPFPSRPLHPFPGRRAHDPGRGRAGSTWVGAPRGAPPETTGGQGGPGGRGSGQRDTSDGDGDRPLQPLGPGLPPRPPGRAGDRAGLPPRPPRRPGGALRGHGRDAPGLGPRPGEGPDRALRRDGARGPGGRPAGNGLLRPALRAGARPAGAPPLRRGQRDERRAPDRPGHGRRLHAAGGRAVHLRRRRRPPGGGPPAAPPGGVRLGGRPGPASPCWWRTPTTTA